MGKEIPLSERLQQLGKPLLRAGLSLNLLWIGRLKFEDYEVENIRPVVTGSPLLSSLAERLGEHRLARAVGLTEITMGAMIASKPVAPRVAAIGSLGAVAMFAFTLSFLITTPEAWQSESREPKLSPAGQFIVKDVVMMAGAMLTASEALAEATKRG
jgi:reactive chlorine resistance protein C